MSEKNAFLDATAEVEDLNQYWYSAPTLETLVAECTGWRCACVSTPSVFFSLDDETRAKSAVLDLDEQWRGVAGYYRYDFNAPAQLDGCPSGAFDMVVIDPPFIDEKVWALYAETALALLDPAGPRRILCTTIKENEDALSRLFSDVGGCTARTWMPKIPNLVYQYSVHTNYDSERLEEANPEVPPLSP